MAKPNQLLFQLPNNLSVRVGAAENNHMTSDAGTLIMRRVIHQTGILNFLGERLVAPRNLLRITYTLVELLLWWILQLFKGSGGLWSDRVLTDPALSASASLDRGERVVRSTWRKVSQSTMSRLLRILSTMKNLEVLQSAVMKLAVEHLLVRNGGKRRDEVIIDVDAMPVDVHGKQHGGKFNGHIKRRVFLPLFATCGETGDVLGARLRPGTQREVTESDRFIVSIFKAVRKLVSDRVIVRMDAGFNGGTFYTQLEKEGVNYLMRLRKNSILQTLVEPYLYARSSKEIEYVELEEPLSKLFIFSCCPG